MKEQPAEKQLTAFLAKYTPEVRALAKALRKKMRARLPGAVEMVYDNYNALVIGFGPTERPSEALFSLALFPRWVTLFFLQGAKLSDPQKLLQGNGNIVRGISLKTVSEFDLPAIEAFIAQAQERSPKPIDPAQRRRLIIKSISAKQRPRRPSMAQRR